jgi:N-acyl homoserine lactone hydrolase
MMRIHAFTTGTMTVKSRYGAAVGRNRMLRLMSSMLDRAWTDIPIFAWVVEHPEGLMVIDTGLYADVNQPGFFPLLQTPYWRSQYRFNITPQDDLSEQMLFHNLRPLDVRWVIMTHHHIDHSGGLHHFPNAQFIVTEREWNTVQRWRSLHFDFPSKWPIWLEPTFSRFEHEGIGPWKRSHIVTAAGDVRLVHTPGHTYGHQAVILEDGDDTYFFGGDISFDLKTLLDGVVDAPAINWGVDMQTRRKVLDFATQRPIIYLTTHDFRTPQRIADRETLQLERVGDSVQYQNGRSPVTA